MCFLEGKKVILRPVDIEDVAGAYYEWINDQAADLYTEHAQLPHTREDLERYIRDRRESSNCVFLAIIERSTGAHIGNIELSDIDWVHRKATLAILVGAQQGRGRGLGIESARLLLRHAFLKLNLHRIELGVHVQNAVALRLYKKLGFVEEGCRREAFLREGRYENIILMGLLAPEFDDSGPV
jgi:RimJ/RimL family protein N-acetyltransferase